jgi:hypothetical protein
VGLDEIASSSDKIEYLFGEAPLPRQDATTSDPDLFSLMQHHTNEIKKASWFEFVYDDLASLCKDATQEKKEGIVKGAFDFFQTLMVYENPRFAVHTFGYLFEQTKDLDLVETSELCDQAHTFYEIIDGYNEPVFAKNFFPYLFEKSRQMETRHHDKLVYIAEQLVAAIVIEVLAETENEEDLAQSYESLKPETTFSEMKFNDEDYAAVKGSMPTDARPKNLSNFRETKTIAESIDYIVSEQGLAEKQE